MKLEASSIGLSTLLAQLETVGWAVCTTDCADEREPLLEARRLGELLGVQVGGRGGKLEEVVRPLSEEDAHPRSLSAMFGLGSLPLHVELSHRLRPCRYVILACVHPGSCGVTTKLLDWRAFQLSASEKEVLSEAPLLIRSGRRSFYSTLLPSDHAFLRFDPICIEAFNERGVMALQSIQHHIALSTPIAYEWERGDIVIFDNWRMLHGRSPSSRESGRRIGRILIDAK